MPKMPWISLVLLVLLQACRHYHYAASTPVATADGERELLASWSRTERALWFDESSETVGLRLQCSPHRVTLREREEGLVFLREPPWTPMGEVPPGLAAYCGRVVGPRTVAEIEVGGELTIELWCALEGDDFSVNRVPGLPPGTYVLRDVGRSRRERTVATCPLVIPASPVSSPTD